MRSTTLSHDETLLKIRDLRTHFYTEDGVVQALDGIDLDVMPGEIVGLVGESGCGKSVTALSVLGLVPDPPGKIVSGEIWFDGRNLLNLSPAAMSREIRGCQIAMIFQDPATSLNPVMRVGSQVAEAIRIHKKVGYKNAWQQAVSMMKKVGIPSADNRAMQYPYQFSGGMKQRIMISMGLSCSPRLLIADECTTALDVTIQAQILQEMKLIKMQTGASILLITHDLGVIGEVADRVAVMYAGQIVEYTTSSILFKSPAHPYTQGLMACFPEANAEKRSLTPIKGTVPNLIKPPSGCRFHPRCNKAVPACAEREPHLIEINPCHEVSCLQYQAGELFK